MSNTNNNYVDDLFAAYLQDPKAVGEVWQDFFADVKPDTPAAKPPPAPKPAVEAPVPEGAKPLTGIAGKIAENMEESLAVPTATSVRDVPVKLLEENRSLINQHQKSAGKSKISFTHILGYAIVQALKKHPAMNAGFAQTPKGPGVVHHPQTNLGLAVDIEKRGTRVLVVPNIKGAESMNFGEFVTAYNGLIQKARDNKLTLEDFKDTTVSLTNPGMIGTSMSVPRLMQGQGVIVGAGAIGYPAEYKGMAPEVISRLGLSKIMTVTSTYDHRIIQGAESGSFLKVIEGLLLGEHDFYREIYRALSIPHEPLAWAPDRNPPGFADSDNAEVVHKQASVMQLVRAYRVRGHLWADINPLGYAPHSSSDLEIATYGLSVWDLDRPFVHGNLGGHEGVLALRKILDILRKTYCQHVGIEYMHIPEAETREWLQQRMESETFAAPLAHADQERILQKLSDAEAFERFLHTTYLGHKRFSLEGAETLIPMLDALLVKAKEEGVDECIMGMAHRGRLNVLTNILGKPYGNIFREFEGDTDPDSTHGSGDVKYHLGAEGEYESGVKLTLAPNPSHLEAVNPVVEGMVRARQKLRGDGDRRNVLPVLLHGDAAFSGQGVVAETLHLSKLKGYATGGTVHVVINNQIGFTASPTDLHSSVYCTDVAKMVKAPIFHVNGHYPEEAVRVIRMALEFRQTFAQDVVIDLVCYRRWGHNEGDDPSYSHPTMYDKISKKLSVRKSYTQDLIRRGDLDIEKAEAMLASFQDKLRQIHDEVSKLPDTEVHAPTDEEHKVGEVHEAAPDTSITAERIQDVAEGLARVPEGFTIHPKLNKILTTRNERIDADAIDWSLGEALAFGSLVLDGTPVRLSGEDCGRGTFSQRHAALIDHQTGEPYFPLANLKEGQAPFVVYDSLLSEFAVLGFEYGYSVRAPQALVLWEAQFGDFANGAQVVIDQFISTAEDKWGQKSNLTMLLPHGYEGQGPEHSSARIERFLQLAGRGNMRVIYPTTPAQYFHALRRQVHLQDRKPLVVFTPKSLLRHPDATSARAAFTGGGFQEVLQDAHEAQLQDVRRIVLCSGKVFYDLEAYRRAQGVNDVLLVRVEQYYPYPGDQLGEIFKRHATVSDVVWVQEEPRNMGAWDFLDERIIDDLQPGQSLRYVGRPSNPSPATGSARRHKKEQDTILAEAFAR